MLLLLLLLLFYIKAHESRTCVCGTIGTSERKSDTTNAIKSQNACILHYHALCVPFTHNSHSHISYTHNSSTANTFSLMIYKWNFQPSVNILKYMPSAASAWFIVIIKCIHSSCKNQHRRTQTKIRSALEWQIYIFRSAKTSILSVECKITVFTWDACDTKWIEFTQRWILIGHRGHVVYDMHILVTFKRTIFVFAWHFILSHYCASVQKNSNSSFVCSFCCCLLCVLSSDCIWVLSHSLVLFLDFAVLQMCPWFR